MRIGGVARALGLLAWLASGVNAYAQTRPASAQPAVVEPYTDLVREAVREFDGGNFVEARTLFEQAHALKPSARTLRGLGISAYELKHYVQAVTELKAALADTRSPLTEAQRTEVGATLTKAERYVGTLELELEPGQASVLIDGQPAEGRELLLDVGDHTLVASASGYRGTEQRVTVLGAQRVTARVLLSPLELSPAQAAGASAPSEPSPLSTPTQDTAQGQSLFSRWWFWTAAGVVVAGAVLATALATSGGSKTAMGNTGTTHVQLQPP